MAGDIVAKRVWRTGWSLAVENSLLEAGGAIIGFRERGWLYQYAGSNNARTHHAVNKMACCAAPNSEHSMSKLLISITCNQLHSCQHRLPWSSA